MTPKAEALAALDHAAEMLAAPAKLTALEWKILAATVEFARKNVAQIQEVKRLRKPTETPA